jgi:hypothetical protein
MAAISQKIFSLIGGVSQQPDTIKSSSQLRECVNFYPDTALGLTKRPGLQGIRKLANAVNGGTWFSIFRDDQEKYIVQFSKTGALKIWSANNGLQQTVNAVGADATAYAAHSVRDDLQTLQINDYIFVLNRTKTVEKGIAVSPVETPYVFVSINTIAYNSTYFITIDATDYSYATPVTTSTTTPQLNVSDIVSNLVAAINVNPDFVATGVGNNIHIKRVNGGDFQITARGGNAGTSIDAFKGSVRSTSQLPRQFINNLKLKVSGSAESNADDYWVIFKTSDNSNTGTGTWEETIAPETVQDLNPKTMPHVIIREGDGTFTYRRIDEGLAALNTGVYSRPLNSTTLTVTKVNHDLTNGTPIYLKFTSGTATDGNYVVANATANTFTVTTVANTAAFGDVRFIKYVPGITTSVAITSATSVGHTIGEQFSVTGGSGNNLRLRVESIDSPITTVTTAANSSTYVKETLDSYVWFLNNVQIGTTVKGSGFRVGGSFYYRNGAFQAINNELRAGVNIQTQTHGIISQVSIIQQGQGYTTSDVVTSASGDTFTITTVLSAPLKGDSSSLNFWKYREVGDDTTNPMPSFVGFPIDAISFFKNRLVFTSRQNVICSQAGDYFNFFASTLITFVDSDPIDISASTLKPIKLKYALAAPQGLLLFGDNSQLLLSTTTESFSPKTAEINILSTFSQTDRLSPLDIGNSYVFLEEGVRASSVYEMILEGGNGKSSAIELTRPIPTYIPTGVVDMQVSTSTGTLAILSKQQSSSLFLWRWFNSGDSRISGWFEWNVPGIIEFFTFDHDVLFVVTQQDNGYVLSKMNLVPEVVDNYTNFSDSVVYQGKSLDVHLDLLDYNPTLIYDSVANLTRICFKNGYEKTTTSFSLFRPQLVFLDPDVLGYFETQSIQFDNTQPVGEKYFLTVPGNRTSSKFALGYSYNSLAILPAFYVVKDEARSIKDTLNVPIVSRVKINTFNSGPYRVDVLNEAVDSFFSLTLPQITANSYQSNSIPIIRNAQSTVPVMARGNQFILALTADYPFQTAFTSIDWEGTYNTKGIRPL